MTSLCIDAHQHLWRYSPPGPAWMGDGLEILRRDFLVNDLRQVTANAGITGTIVVEAERTLEETSWLSQVAGSDDVIWGVVGWTPLTIPGAALELEKIAALPKMKGVRHPIHDEMDDQYILRDDFNRGISALKQFDLRYDILVFEKHLPQTVQFVDRHPKQIFILDHVAKPRIREGLLTPWKDHIRELARRPNVYCKLSGMVTEADWNKWSGEGLAPYIETVLDAFTPRRIMFGSDWPVVTLASTYRQWFDTVRAAIAHLSVDERDWILARTAIKAYDLKQPGISLM
jgi:L-fuconolactonase